MRVFSETLRREDGGQHRLGFVKGHGRPRHEGLEKRAVAVVVAVVRHAMRCEASRAV
jgi:hypothetical protein